MYLLLLSFILHVNVKGESCITPSGQLGECVPIKSCPSLLWSFTNPKEGINQHLQKLVCSNRDLGLIVCCRLATDYLVFENEESVELSDKIKETLPHIEMCGVSSSFEPHNGIIRLNDFPWLVKLMVLDDDEKYDRLERVGCTGVLINKLYVLYSARCHHLILGIDSDFLVRIDTPLLGRDKCSPTDYSQKCTYYETYEIAAFTIHPYYDHQTKVNDIAILRLIRRVYDSDYIQPICLLNTSDSQKIDKTVRTAGWTRTYSANDISVKKSQSSVLISNLDCQRRLHKGGSNFSISPYEICTHSEENVMDNDLIGLPLMFLSGNQWYLQGFESQGKNAKVFTNVQNYLQWIQEAIGEERCFTPYNEKGECTDLNHCPRLMDAFANLSPKNEDALRKFVCRYKNDDTNDEEYIMKVCCGLEPNFTIPLETVHKETIPIISDFHYCGLQHRDDYISTNEGTSVDEFPWLAVILNLTLHKQTQTICAGSLITYRYVLTSGQCLNDFYANDTLLVRLGNHNIKNSSDCTRLDRYDLYDCSDAQEYGVEKKIIHPFYNTYIYINDIALLRLDKQVVFSDYVRPICLPRSEDDTGSSGETLLATGYGDRNKNFAGTRRKKKIPTTLISNKECKEKLKLLGYGYTVTPYQICTEDFNNSTDITCDGDEGGPIMFSKRSRWYIVGISSNYACGDDEPQTQTNVFKYLRWIKLNIEE